MCLCKSFAGRHSCLQHTHARTGSAWGVWWRSSGANGLECVYGYSQGQHAHNITIPRSVPGRHLARGGVCTADDKGGLRCAQSVPAQAGREDVSKLGADGGVGEGRCARARAMAVAGGVVNPARPSTSQRSRAHSPRPRRTLNSHTTQRGTARTTRDGHSARTRVSAGEQRC